MIRKITSDPAFPVGRIAFYQYSHGLLKVKILSSHPNKNFTAIVIQSDGELHPEGEIMVFNKYVFLLEPQ